MSYEEEGVRKRGRWEEEKKKRAGRSSSNNNITQGRRTALATNIGISNNTGSVHGRVDHPKLLLIRQTDILTGDTYEYGLRYRRVNGMVWYTLTPF